MAARRVQQKNGSGLAQPARKTKCNFGCRNIIPSPPKLRLVDNSECDVSMNSDPQPAESLLYPVSVKLEPLDFSLHDLPSNASSVVYDGHKTKLDLWDLKSEIKVELSSDEHLTFEVAEMIVDPFKDCASAEVKPENGQVTKHAIIEESLQHLTPQTRADLVLSEPEKSNQEGRFCHVLKYGDRTEQTPHLGTGKTGKAHTKLKAQNEHLCSLCGNEYASARNLHIHMRIHTGEKPYVCDTCGKAFSRSDRLASHTRIHTSQKRPAKPRRFACSQCERTFALACDLKDHMRRHRQERLHACPVCEKRFFDARDRNRHVEIHSDLKRFVCTECGNSFRRRNTLEKHQRIHTGERPYDCPECGKALRYKYSLAMHMKTHRK